MTNYKRLATEFDALVDTVERSNKARNVRRSKVALLYFALRNKSAISHSLAAMTEGDIDNTELFHIGDRVMHHSTPGTITDISANGAIYVRSKAGSLFVTFAEHLQFDLSPAPDTAPIPAFQVGDTVLYETNYGTKQAEITAIFADTVQLEYAPGGHVIVPINKLSPLPTRAFQVNDKALYTAANGELVQVTVTYITDKRIDIEFDDKSQMTTSVSKLSPLPIVNTEDANTNG